MLLAKVRGIENHSLVQGCWDLVRSFRNCGNSQTGPHKFDGGSKRSRETLFTHRVTSCFTLTCFVPKCKLRMLVSLYGKFR